MHEYRDNNQCAIYVDVMSMSGVIRVNDQGMHFNQPRDRCCARYPSMNTILVGRMQFPRPLSAVCNHPARLSIDEYNKFSIRWWERHD